ALQAHMKNPRLSRGIFICSNEPLLAFLALASTRRFLIFALLPDLSARLGSIELACAYATDASTMRTSIAPLRQKHAPQNFQKLLDRHAPTESIFV
ncbi:hypothetical protein, partial [Desulfovibrio sp.]|uniref:hypothetical protein n=1 Tax=Desulfovibrio sp. TaxID=885 RepID=UPI0025C05AE6